MDAEKRIPHTPISQFYKDVAASAQFQLEQVILHITSYYVAKIGVKNICTAGGVALNCLMSQKLMNASFVDNFFVQPAATDAGISVGAAWLGCIENNILPPSPTTAFLGNEFSNEDIEKTLQICQLDFEKVENKTALAAKDLAEGKVIGWFQGRMEFGPRALGNRSILASPCFADMQQIVNQKVKFRESFRPFGASVLEEDMSIFFEGNEKRAPYMTLVFDVKKEQKNKIPAVVHADGSCRIQTVSQYDSPLLFQLISDFKKLSSVGVLLNTSFNLNHEPIVNTPREAIASFFSSGIDVLYLGDFRIQKKSHDHT
jgi:carbamoyltransferase